MNDYKTLDFDKVKNIIAEYSPILEAKEYIFNEQVDFNPLVIKRKLEETKDFLDYLNNGNSLSFDGIVNPCSILDKAKKGIILSSNEILEFYTFHNHSRRIKKAINNNDDLSLIKEYSDSIILNDDISKKIENIIDGNGNVKSDATSELERIFKEIDDNFSNINSFCLNFIKDNGEYLQENNVCERNNRYVFLFKNNYKNKFDGYDYGSSGSGQAVYIEPSSLVSLNNKRNELEELKKQEINRILKSLSQDISEFSDSYKNNFDILVNISVVYSKAYFGYINQGTIGKLDDYLYLQNVKHPLLDPDKVVSNTYSLRNEYKGIIISGSNTGGKTISLKVIGLSICMTYLGIPVIGENVIVPLFDNILVDVDSNQSIKDSLSTFSAHLSSINEIINKATNKSIVLIDELISGTDPKEAEAISLSIIKKLLNIGSSIIVTTHYNLIKKFAYDRNDLLLSSVEFDSKSLKPTYRYIENSFGESNAFDIANRYLSDNSIINEARNIFDNNKSNEEKVFSELSNKMQEIESLKKDLVNKTTDLVLKRKELDEKIAKFDETISERKNEIIKSFNEELDSIKEEINTKVKMTANNKELMNISNKIKNVDLVKVGNENVKFEVGNRVRVNDIGNPGYIISIDGDKYKVDINGLIISTNKNSLSLLPNVEQKKTVEEKKFHSAPSEIVVVGERAEEALRLIDEFLDKARLANLKKVKIIHGIGTLALKNAIWDYLIKINYIDRFYSADYYDGGLAATIVEFK